MKKIYGTILSFLVIMCFAARCYGYGYQLSAMKKLINAPLNKSQLVIGIYDYHDKDHPANADQRLYLEESILKKYKDLNFKLIVEDLSSINNSGKGMCCNYVINARGGVLGKLADIARGYSIDVDNVEYRFCRVAGVGPLLNKDYKKPQECASAVSISMNALCKEVTDEIKDISHYNDGSRINVEYKRIMSEVTKAFQNLKLNQIEGLSIADFCARFNKDNYKRNLEKLCIFDSPLIDAKILHSIISSDKSIIIVAAGGSHIENMNAFLASIGYKKILMPPVTAHKQQSIESSLSSGNKKHHLFRPFAINLAALEQFMNQ